MLDIVCVLLIYFIFLLNLFGVEMIFMFKAVMTICIIRLVITALKLLRGVPYQESEMPDFLHRYFNITSTFGSSITCIMFTVFSTWTMKTIFFGFLIIVFLVALIFKNIHVRASLLIIFSSCYGIILAKWYQVHPLEGRFGDNGFLDSLGIVLSAILLIIPVLRITQKNQISQK